MQVPEDQSGTLSRREKLAGLAKVARYRPGLTLLIVGCSLIVALL